MEVNAKIIVDTSQIDIAIKKMEKLLSLVAQAEELNPGILLED